MAGGNNGAIAITRPTPSRAMSIARSIDASGGRRNALALASVGMPMRIMYVLWRVRRGADVRRGARALAARRRRPSKMQ